MIWDCPRQDMLKEQAAYGALEEQAASFQEPWVALSGSHVEPTDIEVFGWNWSISYFSQAFTTHLLVSFWSQRCGEFSPIFPCCRLSTFGAQPLPGHFRLWLWRPGRQLRHLRRCRIPRRLRCQRGAVPGLRRAGAGSHAHATTHRHAGGATSSAAAGAGCMVRIERAIAVFVEWPKAVLEDPVLVDICWILFWGVCWRCPRNVVL